MPELNRSPEKLLPNKTVQLTPDPIMRIKKKRNITAGVGVGDVGGDGGGGYYCVILPLRSEEGISVSGLWAGCDW